MAVPGRALVIFHDHRPHMVEANRRRLEAEVPANVKGVTKATARPLRLLFGERPYHVLAELEAVDEDTLLRAFQYIEDHFSHVEGFG